MDDNPMTLVSLESVNNLVREHLEHGEFVHGGRYECADAILAELGQLAALKQPRTQWQPISTAPKDGARVDLWIPKDADAGEAHRCPDCLYRDGGWLLSGEFDVPWLKDATHWHPVPEPPEASRAK